MMESATSRTQSLSLRLLGRPSITDNDGNRLAGLPVKAFVLFALLSLGPADGLTRTEAALRLWEDSAPTQGSANLRQLLFRVRRIEDRDTRQLLQLEGEHIRLAPDLRDSDVRRVLAIHAVHTAGAMHTLTRLYPGDFLEEIEETGGVLRAWIDSERARLREWVTRLVLDGLPRVDPLTGGIALRHLADLTPPSTDAIRALVRHLLAQGRSWEARRYLHEVHQRLGDEADSLFVEESRLLLEASAQPAARPQVRDILEATRAAAVPRVALLFTAEAGLPPSLSALARAFNEDITIALSRLRSFSVLAAYSAGRLGQARDPRVMEYFELDYVVTMRVAPDPLGGDSTRLTVMLERVPTRELLWADRYVFSLDAGPARYAEITTTLATALADKIERVEFRAFETTDNPSAYALYLGGLDRLASIDLPEIRRARKHFRDALERSPGFSPALSGIAQTLVYEWVLRSGADPELLVRAQTSAARAIEFDPLESNGHRTLGRAKLFQGMFDESVADLERAVHLSPHHADLLCDYADTLLHNSDLANAQTQIEAALRLNPLAPDVYWWVSGAIKFFLGHYETALDHLQRMKNDEPVLRLIAACAAMAGQAGLAKSARLGAMAIDPGFRLDDWVAVIPLRDPAHAAHYRDALRLAGFK